MDKRVIGFILIVLALLILTALSFVGKMNQDIAILSGLTAIFGGILILLG